MVVGYRKKIFVLCQSSYTSKTPLKIKFSFSFIAMDFFLTYCILVILSPLSTPYNSSSPTLPSGSTLFLSLIRKTSRVLTGNNEKNKI